MVAADFKKMYNLQLMMMLMLLQMFIEFCGGGALDSIMVDLEKGLTEEQIRYVCHEMCVGLDFLHRHHVIHRDIKAGNVLLTTDGEVKLGMLMLSAVRCGYKQHGMLVLSAVQCGHKQHGMLMLSAVQC